MKKAVLTLIFPALLITFPASTLALQVPSFGTCENPQGTLKAAYSQGSHGIVGSTATYTGSDTVYTLSATTYLQCFCSVDGNGISTYWWRSADLTQNEGKILENQGWRYVANGALWGLDEGPFYAKNVGYQCAPVVGGSPNPDDGGEVLGDGTGGAILGLAATGNTLDILLLGLGGIWLVLLGLILLTRSKHA